jgi:hypothetical protein
VTRACVEQAPTSSSRRPASASAAGWRPPTAGASASRCAPASDARAARPRSQGQGRRPRRRTGRVLVPGVRGLRRGARPAARGGRRGQARRGAAARRAAGRVHRRAAAAGAEVVEVPVYRWVLPEDVRPLRRLVEQTVAGSVDCMTFTSAPAVSSTWPWPRARGEHELVEALRGPVLVAAVGPVTAAPLDRAGIPSVQPERARSGRWPHRRRSAAGPPQGEDTAARRCAARRRPAPLTPGPEGGPGPSGSVAVRDPCRSSATGPGSGTPPVRALSARLVTRPAPSSAAGARPGLVALSASAGSC